MKLGAYHTLDLELNRPFSLEKPVWDAMDLHRLELCADISKNIFVLEKIIFFKWKLFVFLKCTFLGNTADVAAVIMHEGLANICLLSSSMTVVKAKIDMQVGFYLKN